MKKTELCLGKIKEAMQKYRNICLSLTVSQLKLYLDIPRFYSKPFKSQKH